MIQRSSDRPFKTVFFLGTKKLFYKKIQPELASKSLLQNELKKLLVDQE
jgi:hypothetical protein